MITVRLKGGLGNQLFQYATARALSIKHQTGVAFDLGFLSGRDQTSQHTFREYELDVLNIPPVEPSLLDKIAFGLTDLPAQKLLQRVVKRAVAAKTYTEKTFSYDAGIEGKTSRFTYLNGYFPSEKYFKSIEPALRAELQFRTKLNIPVADTIQSTCSVSMHIRRGDYITNLSAKHYHGLCSVEYYKEAINYLAIRQSNIHIFVFSDDLEWARKSLDLSYPTFFVEGNTGKNSYLDMQLMSLCKHHIIANSSFSWWGAWLNPSPDKIVVAPKRWFADEAAQGQAHDMIPDTWIKLA